MTTTKNISDQYDQVGAELKKKLQPLFAEKNKKRAAIKELFGDDPKKLYQESADMRSKLNQKWKSENSDLLETYTSLYNQKQIEQPLVMQKKQKEQKELSQKSQNTLTQSTKILNQITFVPSGLSPIISDEINAYVQKKMGEDMKRAGFNEVDMYVIYECIQKSEPIPQQYKPKLYKLIKHFSETYPEFYNIKQIENYYQRLEDYSLHKVVMKTVNHIPKGETKPETVYQVNGLPNRDRLAIVDIIEFQTNGSKTEEEEMTLKKIAYGQQLSPNQLAIVKKYLMSYIDYVSLKNDSKTNLQKLTYKDLVAYLEDNQKKSYVKTVLKNELMTIIRLENRKKGLPVVIEKKREIKQNNITTASTLLSLVKENVYALSELYKLEKTNWNTKLHEYLEGKSLTDKVAIVHTLLARIYKDTDAFVIRSAFSDMTVIDDLGIWLGIVFFYAEGFKTNNEAYKTNVLQMVAKLTDDEVEGLLQAEHSNDISENEKKIIALLRPILETRSKQMDHQNHEQEELNSDGGKQKKEATPGEKIRKNYTALDIPKVTELYQLRATMYDLDFLAKTKNTLNKGFNKFKDAFSDYIGEKCEQEKSLEKGVNETVYFMSFLHDNLETSRLFNNLGIKSNMFSILDETNLPILIGMMAYYNSKVTASNNGRIKILYYLFQNMKEKSLAELIQSVDTIIDNKEYNSDLKDSLCRMMLNYSFRSKDLKRESCSIDTDWMHEGKIMHDGDDYMEESEREIPTDNSDLTHIFNPEGYIKEIIETQKRKQEQFPDDIFTGFDESLEFLNIIRRVDRGIYYDIIEDLLESQKYSSETEKGWDQPVTIPNANKFKDVISILTKNCPTPEELKNIAQVSISIDRDTSPIYKDVSQHTMLPRSASKENENTADTNNNRDIIELDNYLNRNFKGQIDDEDGVVSEKVVEEPINTKQNKDILVDEDVQEIPEVFSEDALGLSQDDLNFVEEDEENNN